MAQPFGELIRAIVRELNIELSSSQMASLEQHYLLLEKWNRRINLTSVSEPAEIVRRHFGESLFAARCLSLSTGTLVDIGSGAGFPGVPIAVACPGVNVTLIESVAKRAAFLKELARLVPNVTVIRARLEAVEERFDWAVVRGVRLAAILKHLQPRAGKFGAFVPTVEVSGLPVQVSAVWPVPWEQSRSFVTGSLG